MAFENLLITQRRKYAGRFPWWQR